ncbi:hypothetical protein ACFFSH_31105 [Streptomyces filamentosus]|uniref:Uncharacterized protein n=1 Tax=Streptomyces filamentosus TaxID=67294 RepID=A0A919BUA3_STRFL|nr:hypothetical protein [Streptomyces filamentosus]GHG13820.1 hypothetical protein GCM10017667_54860 [Streptomyces filamentosus]
MTTAVVTSTLAHPDVVAAIDAGTKMAAEESGRSLSSERFTWATAAALTYLDNTEAPWADVCARHLEITAAQAAACRGDEVEDTSDLYEGMRYSREQVSAAVNAGVDAAAETIRECADDIDNLTVNAILTLLDHPDASFAEVVAECYDGEGVDDVSGWLADVPADSEADFDAVRAARIDAYLRSVDL